MYIWAEWMRDYMTNGCTSRSQDRLSSPFPARCWHESMYYWKCIVLTTWGRKWKWIEDMKWMCDTE